MLKCIKKNLQLLKYKIKIVYNITTSFDAKVPALCLKLQSKIVAIYYCVKLLKQHKQEDFGLITIILLFGLMACGRNNWCNYINLYSLNLSENLLCKFRYFI